MQYLQLYGLTGVSSVMPLPIIATSAPTGNNTNAVFGQQWINTTTGNVYVFGGTVAGQAIWAGAGGVGNFTTLTVTAGPNSITGTTSINASQNFNTNINTGTSTGAVNIGNLGNAGAVTIASNAGIVVTSNGVVALDSNGVSVDIGENLLSDINIGTFAGVKTVQIGNNDQNTTIILDGPVTIGVAGSPTITSGAGAPASNQPKGSLYLRTNGTTNTTRMYVATDAVGTWTAVNTVA